jgi:hypothetical protein
VCITKNTENAENSFLMLVPKNSVKLVNSFEIPELKIRFESIPGVQPKYGWLLRYWPTDDYSFNGVLVDRYEELIYIISGKKTNNWSLFKLCFAPEIKKVWRRAHLKELPSLPRNGFNFEDARKVMSENALLNLRNNPRFALSHDDLKEKLENLETGFSNGTRYRIGFNQKANFFLEYHWEWEKDEVCDGALKVITFENGYKYLLDINGGQLDFNKSEPWDLPWENGNFW